MSKSLYNIEAEYMNLAEQLTENGGELSIELQDLLTINKAELEHKGQSYAFVIKSCEDSKAIIKAERERLAELDKRIDSTIERLKSSVKDAMELYDITEIKTPLIKISFRKSESVEIINMAQLDSKYLVEKVSVSPDKIAIKNDLKNGVEVDGAVLVTNNNLQIK